MLAMGERLDSETARTGQIFSLTVAEDVLVDGAVVVPKGAGAQGTVLFARKKGSARSGALDLRVDHVETPVGRVRVRASLSRRSKYLAAAHAADYALRGLGFSVQTEQGEAIVLQPGALIDVEAISGTAIAAAHPIARPAWVPEAKSGQGLVIIFRERRFYGSANSIQVYSDEGMPLPKVKNGQFVHQFLSAGDHRLYADKRKQRDARIVGIEAGEVYFFEARFEAKASIGADVDLVPVEYADGVRRIEGLGEGAKPVQ